MREGAVASIQLYLNEGHPRPEDVRAFVNFGSVTDKI